MFFLPLPAKFADMTKLINLNIFKRFFSSSSAGGVILLLCVAISLTIANIGWAESFNGLLQMKLGRDFGAIDLEYPLITWINDGLMAVFFLLVGLEIKREIIEGELSSFRQASLPVLAAIGGVAVPALLYASLNASNPQTAAGWGIPMATDIAFALGIISLLGSRVPNGLKIFLAALAIVDDLIAILVIAIFYSSEIHLIYLAYAAGIMSLLIIFNRCGVKNIFCYIIPGEAMWYLVHHSGIHATIAGVLTALALPTNEDDTESPLEKLEHSLTIPVNFFIMPLFAIANTCITFESGMIEGLVGSIGMGIILGLFLGKPAGIFLMSWLAVKLKISELPDQTSWPHVLGLGILGGIGFTMSIFIALLSFKQPELQLQAKFAVLTASLLAGALGYAILYLYDRRSEKS